jgi:hypothetical protein
MSRPEEEDVFALGLDDEANDGEWDDEDSAPGPDERDMDLMDGSWEQKYYTGRQRSVDWNTILVGMGLLALAGMLIPVFLVVFR